MTPRLEAPPPAFGTRAPDKIHEAPPAQCTEERVGISARHRRETYMGPWLPEPVVESAGEAEADDITLPLMIALERLSPLERAAFLPHDVFDVGIGGSPRRWGAIRPRFHMPKERGLRSRVQLGRLGGNDLQLRNTKSPLQQKVLEETESREYAITMPVSRAEPVEIQAHAIDNLRYIRQTMERAGSFTAVPGLGGVLMGSTALVAAWIAGPGTGSTRWLAAWLLEGAVAVAIGAAGAWFKSQRAKLPLLSGPGRKFVAGFAPAMAAGGLLTAVLVARGQADLLPGLWLLLYGAAVCSGGSASVRVVPLMGACFMLAGAAACLVPAAAGSVVLAAGFGGFHIIFGAIIAVKYGG